MPDAETPEFDPEKREFEELDTGDLPFTRDVLGGLGAFSPEGCPERIGNYEILEALGEGGMGVVYRARQERPVKREVAIKLVRSGSDTREVVERFERERQALALMNHPHIARIYEAGASADGRPYFVMELIDGVPLNEFLRSARLSIRERVQLLLQVVDAVQHAHQRALVHRDLKPSNLLVETIAGRPHVKIIDFGIAKAVDSPLATRADQTVAGQIIGTLEYMSPEQASGRPGEVDTRSDIFALGVLLFEGFTGELPLRLSAQASINQFLQSLQLDEPPLASKVLRKASARDEKPTARLDRQARKLEGDLDLITAKCLDRSPAQRYQTAAALGEDLRRWLDLRPILARPPSAWYRLKKYGARHRALTLSVAALLLLAGAAMVGFWCWAHSRAGNLRQSGLRALESASHHDGVFVATRGELEQLSKQLPKNAPIWMRGDEFRLRGSARELREKTATAFQEADDALSRARAVAPWASLERRRIELASVRVEQERLRLLREGRPISDTESTIAGRIARYSPDEHRKLLEERFRVHIVVERPSRIATYRFETIGERRLALPWPSGRRSPSLLLRVRAVHRQDEVIEPGDEIESIDAAPVVGPSELMRALADVQVGGSVHLGLLRGERKLKVDWVPFEKARRPLDSVENQLGIELEGYPLGDPDAWQEVDASGGLDLELPRGQYLLRVEADDAGRDLRYPLDIPADAGTHTIRTGLPRPPKAFCRVPAGRFTAGGDREAYRSAELRRNARLPEFALARDEVTLDEFREFLVEVLPVTAAPGLRPGQRRVNDALFDRVREACGLEASDTRVVDVVPRYYQGKQSYDAFVVDPARGEGGRNPWVLHERLDAASPVQYVPLPVACVYARWYQETHGVPGWRIRLPQGLEWEKAARGVDARFFVWGDRFYPSFVGSGYDESVYGVRKMMGSLAEWVTDAELALSPGLAPLRGAWDWVDTERDARAAARGATDLLRPAYYVGVRLAAELTAAESTTEAR